MANFYPNGAGGTTGDIWATCKPLYTSGAIWYVDSQTGTDAAAPAGKNREKPLATLAQAVTNSADNDIIVCLSGHTQTLTGVQQFLKKLTVVGEGSTSGVPTVVFTPDMAAATMFQVASSNVEFRNIKIAQQTQANSAQKIVCDSTDFVMDGCYVECGEFDDAAALALASGSNRTLLRNTTFISVASLTSAQPESAIKLAAAITDLTLDGLVLSAGTVGFSNYFAFDGSLGAVTRLRGLGVSLLLGADMTLATGTTGRLNVQTSTGGSRVEWA